MSALAPPAGCLISFEGIDGAGKSSHIDHVAARWLARGLPVERSREPGGTPLAEALRELVLQQPMDALTEALLVFAGRRDHLQQRIEPALAAGAVVLCDRYTDATFAYQGAGRGFDRAVLEALERWVQQGPAGLRQPDLTFWFDLDPAIAAERLSAARAPDRFERATLKALKVHDPLEPFNRRMYLLNLQLDQRVLVPTMRYYRFFVPSPVRSGVRNV